MARVGRANSWDQVPKVRTSASECECVCSGIGVFGESYYPVWESDKKPLTRGKCDKKQ